ncbi:coiled-coil domain-containing protein 51 [Ditylenchus destructor]|nr:coiled-coil domain-containing protein 51 [Ditylenchus destructor]
MRAFAITRQCCTCNRLLASRLCSTSVTPISPTKSASDKLKHWVASTGEVYDKFTGLQEVHNARNQVREWEDRLQNAQQNRRHKQKELTQLQIKIKQIHHELERHQRGEERWLSLMQEEFAAYAAEKPLLTEFAELEKQERDAFQMLSNKVRASHESEREHESRTKYWSLISGAVGLVGGVIASSLNNYYKMKHLNEMFPRSQQIRPILDEISDITQKQQEQIFEVAKFLCDVRDALKVNPSKLQPVTIEKPGGTSDETLRILKEQHTALSSQMEELKRLIFLDQSLSGVRPDSVVYVGNEMGSLLDEAEKKIEAKWQRRSSTCTFGKADKKKIQQKVTV